MKKENIFSYFLCCLIFGIPLCLSGLLIAGATTNNTRTVKSVEGDIYRVVTFHSCCFCDSISVDEFPIFEIEGQLYYEKQKMFIGKELILIEGES